jgi:hypothetical protein
MVAHEAAAGRLLLRGKPAKTQRWLNLPFAALGHRAKGRIAIATPE